MSDIPHLLQRQAAWQKSRKDLSWPDKIRMVEAVQGTLRQLRALKNNFQESRKEQQFTKTQDGIDVKSHFRIP